MLTLRNRLIGALALALMLAGLLFVGPAVAAGPDSGTSFQPSAGRMLGMVPVVSRTTAAPVRPYLGSGNLSYHNGPVMHTNKVYAIYWIPSGYTVSANYQSLIDGFFQNVSADSGKTSNVYYSDTQYRDRVNGYILYSSTFGGSVVDTNPFPASGCTDSYTSICLTDGQIQT